MKAIAALENRGEVLRTQHRYLRAAKKFAAAAALAHALPHGGDSLIVARMQAEQAWSLIVLSQKMLIMPAAERAPPPGNEGANALECFLEALQLLSSAADIIRQRRAANTLLRHTCRPEEEAEFRFSMEAANDECDFGEGRLETYGEDTLFLAGSYALVALSVFARQLSGTPASGLMPDAVVIVEDACALLKLPRDGPPEGLTDQELYFARRCTQVLKDVFCSAVFISRFCSRPDVRPILAPLQQMWLQLRGCPAFLRATGDDMQQSYSEGAQEWKAHLANEAAEQRKHTCAHCGVAEAVRGDFKACARCHSIYFCCNEHQVAHWKTHKKTCVQRT